MATARKLHAVEPEEISGYEFKGGYPTEETIQRVYDEVDLNRAIEAYRFFYATVSGASICKGNQEMGIVPNRDFAIIDTLPRHVIFTANSDTPYGPMDIDLKDGPIVVELPPGPLIVVAIDINQRWVADMGVPGPDAGKGGRHLMLPPGYTGAIPAGYHVWRSATNRLTVGARSLPVQGDVNGAIELIRKIQVHPLQRTSGWKETTWSDRTGEIIDTTPLSIETSLGYWKLLHEVIQYEPANEVYRDWYGELAALGIERDRPFNPDSRMINILENAARIGNAQMRVISFADRRPDRIVWPDRQWEWAALRFEDGDFNQDYYADLDAREKWFFQAIGASPAMFRRKEGQGSLYWGGFRDQDGEYLDGGRTYKLTVPQPVPASLFWSVTAYDAETRSQIQARQGKAALRSLFELTDTAGEKYSHLYFGPDKPLGHEGHWIQTLPGRGWFAYFRIYGPKAAAFDGGWKPDDFVMQ